MDKPLKYISISITISVIAFLVWNYFTIKAQEQYLTDEVTSSTQRIDYHRSRVEAYQEDLDKMHLELEEIEREKQRWEATRQR